MQLATSSMLGIIKRALPAFTYSIFTQQPYEVGTVTVLILQMETEARRGELAVGHPLLQECECRQSGSKRNVSVRENEVWRCKQVDLAALGVRSDMGLQNERAGLPTGGSVCTGGPEGWGGRLPGECTGATWSSTTAVNQVPVIALQAPRGRRDPSGCLRKMKPRGDTEKERDSSEVTQPVSGKLRPQT